MQTEIPGFGSYVLAIFLTPIYCITRKKWIGFILSTILYILATFTIFIFGLGLIFWLLAALPAAFSLRNEIIEAHARRTGEETAKAIAAAGIFSGGQRNVGTAETSEEKACPMCAESVKAAAAVCKHCGYKFDGSGAPGESKTDGESDTTSETSTVIGSAPPEAMPSHEPAEPEEQVTRAWGAREATVNMQSEPPDVQDASEAKGTKATDILDETATRAPEGTMKPEPQKQTGADNRVKAEKPKRAALVAGVIILCLILAGAAYYKLIKPRYDVGKALSVAVGSSQAESAPRRDVLVFAISDNVARKNTEVGIRAGSSYNVGNSSLVIRAVNYVPDFRMEGESVVSATPNPNNPAVNVVITENGVEIFKGWMYSKNPSVHPFQHQRFTVTFKEPR